MGLALVTGGARRIGAAIVRRLAEDGHSVAIQYRRSEQDALALVEELRSNGHDVMSFQVDLRDTAEIEALISGLRPSILINNASAFTPDDISSLEPSVFNEIMETNLLAPILLVQAMTKSLEGREGVVVNILDQKLENPNPDFLSYTASKVALGGLTKPLAMTLAPSIRLNAVSPGLTLPSPHASVESFADVHEDTPLGRGTSPEDVAEAVSFLVASSAITGEIINVDCGERLWKSRGDRLGVE